MSRELKEIRFPSPGEIFREVLEASVFSEEERKRKLEDFGAAMIFDKLDFYESVMYCQLKQAACRSQENPSRLRGHMTLARPRQELAYRGSLVSECFSRRSRRREGSSRSAYS